MILKMMQVDHIIKHCPEAKNPADAPSCRADYQPTPEDYVQPKNILNLTTVQIPLDLEHDLFRELPLDDLAKDLAPDQLTVNTGGWEWDDNILLHHGKIYVPASLREQVIQACHDDLLAGHFGVHCTEDLVRCLYYWLKLRELVSSYIWGCPTCAQMKADWHPPYGLLELLPLPEGWWSRVHMDFITDLPLTKQNNDAVMVMIDAYTKQGHFVPVCMKGKIKHRLDAKGAAQIVRQDLIKHHGLPMTFIMDWDKQFVNTLWKDLCTQLQITHSPTTAYHSQGNRQAERPNGVIEAYLHSYINYEQDDWDEWMDQCEFSYNNSRHEATQMSPFYADTGRHPQTTILTERPGEPLGNAEAAAQVDHLNDLNKVLNQNLTKIQEHMGCYYD